MIADVRAHTMAIRTPEDIRARTDAKLRYSTIHLEELRKHDGNGGTDFDRCFHESFLFHLLGAKDAFVSELNVYYAGDLPDVSLTPGSLRDKLAKKGMKSMELAELYSLENDQQSWFSTAKAMRDHSTHVDGVPRAFHLNGPNHGKVFLRNPKTLETVDLHVLDTFDEWLRNMHALLERLRTSALVAYAP